MTGFPHWIIHIFKENAKHDTPIYISFQAGMGFGSCLRFSGGSDRGCPRRLFTQDPHFKKTFGACWFLTACRVVNIEGT